ncbi:hypothetical protein VTK73DRAFT_4184 [Phialemonium thermophilum]|uniref:C2H2-type domain-containing protein n=1 Tax=Phialemonium thermophilum TaxID=223376 RepID=A0ABR3WVG5_9PEZI
MSDLAQFQSGTASSDRAGSIGNNRMSSDGTTISFSTGVCEEAFSTQSGSLSDAFSQPQPSQSMSCQQRPPLASPTGPTRGHVAVFLGTTSDPKGPVQSSELHRDDSHSDVVVSDIRKLHRDPLPASLAKLAMPSRRIPKPSAHQQDWQNQKAPQSTSSQSIFSADPPKRRGRPVGWRPGMGPYSALATFRGGPSVSRPKKAPSSDTPKRRVGRPPGRGWAPPRTIFDQLNPKYFPFVCEWEGCPAELENLGKLRKHLLVVHGQSRTCQWRKCASKIPPERFESLDHFQRHVDETHLVSIAWFVGDGPKNSSSENEVTRMIPNANNLPTYLLDANGNQVTPSVLYQDLENEEERKLRRRRLQKIILQRDRNAPEEEPDSPLDDEEHVFGKI